MRARRHRRRSSANTCARAWPSGGCPTSSRSWRRSRRRAWASSTRRCCARGASRGRWRDAWGWPDRAAGPRRAVIDEHHARGARRPRCVRSAERVTACLRRYRVAVGVRAANRVTQVIETAGLQVGDRLADGQTRSHAVPTEFANSRRATREDGPWRLPHHQREVGMSTDVVASIGPRKAGAAPLSRGSSRAWRRLSVVPVALLLAAALLGPDTAVAAEPTSGYSQTAPTPKTTPSTPAKTTPTTGTSPSKEEKTTP